MKRNMKNGLVGLVAAITLGLAIAPPSAADELPSAEIDPVPESVDVTFEMAEEDSHRGDHADSDIEREAVAEYTEVDPVFTDSSDVNVTTLTSGELEIIVVSPADEVAVGEVSVSIDSDTDEITMSTEMEVESDQPAVASPGMAGWPAWSSRPQYQITNRVYYSDNFIGYGRFTTKFRKNTDSSTIDKWEITRSAVAFPDSYEIPGPDFATHVKKLWISSKLKDGTDKNRTQWLDDRTVPLESKSVCSQVGATIGPWGAGFTDCSDWTVDQPSVAHMRVSLDQGAVTSGGSRKIGYNAAFGMKKGAAVSTHYYQFVTFKVLRAGLDVTKKCSSDGRGANESSSSEVVKC